MSVTKIVSIALIKADLLGLVYVSFICTRETREAKIGSFELSVKDTQRLMLLSGPVWWRYWLAACLLLSATNANQ